MVLKVMMMLKIIKITKIMMRMLKMVVMTTMLRKKAVKVLPTVQLTSQGSGAIVIKTEAEGLGKTPIGKHLQRMKLWVSLGGITATQQ